MVVAPKKKKLFDSNYEILSLIGRGSKSVVYHAKVEQTGDDVALKVILNEGDTSQVIERMRTEAFGMLTAQHPHVVQLYDFRHTGELCYLCLEYAPLGDLAQFTRQQGGTLAHLQAVTFFQQIAEALQQIHAVGMIHRDIKPENILIVDEETCKLGDFGIAAIPGEPLPETDHQKGIGSFDYLAPEVLEGKPHTIWSDQYALALSFYEVMTGHHPFRDVPLFSLLEVRRKPQLSGLRLVGPGLREVIAKALHYDPEERFSSIEQLLEEVQQLAALSPTATSVVGTGIPGIEEKFQENFIEEEYLEELGEENTDDAVSQLYEPENREEYSYDEEPSTYEEYDKDEEPFTSQKASYSSAHPEGNTLNPLFSKVRIDETHETQMFSKEMMEEVRRLHYEQEVDETPASFSKKPFIILLGLLATAGLIFILFPSPFSSALLSQKEPQVQVPQEDMVPFLGLPTLQEGSALEFPALPAGTYQGEIAGILPGWHASLLFIVPFPHKAYVLIGEEGWGIKEMHKKVNEEGEEVFEVAINGFILQFTGKVEDSSIKGEVLDVASGIEGKWVVTPRRKG